ncbi:MAG TPA: hypothetical protein VGD10_04215 [Allosphingosinicella sp.]|uniref:hypothetical protein n=1 Tax=Allosphingosinicella sp. TaxID=2823234 RepID=UPI002EDB8CC2
MSHLAIILFFGLVFVGAGMAAQLLVRDYRREIAAALLGRKPVRRPAPQREFKVTVRANPGFARRAVAA